MAADPPKPGDSEIVDNLVLPSLVLLAKQVGAERSNMNEHAESLDTKSGVVLGFAGILVGLSATAHVVVAESWLFRAGMVVAIVAVLLSTWAFFPRRYPVLEVLKLRERYLMAPEVETRLYLLDTEIEMVRETAKLVKSKGRRVSASIVSLAIAAALIIAGILIDAERILTLWLTRKGLRIPQQPIQFRQLQNDHKHLLIDQIRS